MNTWIFLRGLTRETRHWGSFVLTFAEQVADAQVVALDLPGNGAMHRMASPTSIETMAEHCRSELRRRGLPGPYHLLAMSLGAMVAVAWAANYPSEVQACVLLNTSLRPFCPFHWRLRPQSYPTLLKLLLTRRGALQVEQDILRLTSRREALSSRALLDDWVAWRDEHPVSRRQALRQMWAAARYRAPLVKPVARLLILSSRYDALVDPRCSRTIASRWHADFAEHPSAGHDLALDDGAWVAMQVSRWW
jgi:pimeloyl-ACP methyl ester carboxylesterase